MAATKSRGGKRAGAARRSVSQLGKEDREGFGAWIARHLEWMRVRNYSEATVRTREPWLVVFAQWCEARGIQRPREVTKPILESYRRQLFYHRKQNGKALTFGSQRARLAPLKLFFGWMTRQNGLLWNPASELDLPRVEKRLPRALTEEEVERVLAQPALDGALGLRDRAVLEVLYSTGMRRSELVALRLSEVAATEGTVFVRQGKGKKDRVVPIGDACARRGWRKLHRRGEAALLSGRTEDALFLSERAAPRIEAGTLTHRVRRYVEAREARQARVVPPVSAHDGDADARGRR
jgi:integrase/recombinase XerD